MKQFLKNLGRLAALCGLLGVLTWLLVSRQLAVVDRDKLAERKRSIENESRFGIPIDVLDEEALKEAQAAKLEIVDLRAQKRKAIEWPALVVPVAVNARTSTQVAEDYLQFRLREFEAYRQLTRDTGQARIAGERFVEAYVRSAAERKSDSIDYGKLFALGNAAVEAGSRDPLLRTFHALVKWQVDGDTSMAEPVWREVLAELPKTKYPQTIQVYANCFLHDMVNSHDQIEATIRWKPVVLSIVRWLEEETEHPEWLGSTCERLLTLWGNASSKDREDLLARILDSDRISPYFVHYLAGDFYVTRAWSHRGVSYASQLTSEQASNFSKYINIAADHLLYAWKLHPELPYPQAQLITVAMTGEASINGPYFWFIQTIDAQLDYYSAYSSLMNSLLPRWGGSHEQMLQFGNNCLHTNRFQTCVPYIAIEALEHLVDWEKESLVLNPSAMKLLRDFVAARSVYRAAHPGDELYEKGGTYGARLLLKLEECNLLNLAADEARSAGEDMDWTTLRRGARPGRYLAARLVAADGDRRSQVLAFDQKLRQPWGSDRAEELVAELFEECRALKESILREDDGSGEFFRQADCLLGQLRSFSAGEWVPLEIDSRLTGWEPYCDSWSVPQDGRVDLSGRWRKSPQVCLRPLANFHPPVEIEGKLELLDPEPYLSGVGIGWSREAMKDSADCLPTQPFFGLQAQRGISFPEKEKKRRDFAWNTKGSAVGSALYPLSSPGVHQLKLKLWNHAAEYRVDDRVWLTLNMPKGLHPDGWICFGQIAPFEENILRYTAGGAMRWSDLRIRRLEIASPPLDSEPLASRAEYWEQRCASDADDVVASAKLCAIRFEQGRPNDVLGLVDQILAKRPEIHGVHCWKGMVLYDVCRDYAAAHEELRLAGAEPNSDPEVMSREAELLAAAPDESLRVGKVAKQNAEFSVKFTDRKHARSLSALAAAHAELGEFDEAIRIQKDAMALASEKEHRDWEKRLESYEAHQPFRLPIRAGF
jgi:tetratricopeptide (TPR) repeat protein